MDFAIQAACSFLPSPLAPHAANLLRSFQSSAGSGSESDRSHGPVLDWLKGQMPLVVSLIGVYFAATSMLRTLRVAYRSSLFLAKYGSLVGLLAVLYRAWSSTDPAQSLESSLSAAVHSVGTVGSLAGSALVGLSMLVGGETGDNVRKLASWLGPTNDKKKKAAEEEEGDAPPAYGTRSRRRTKAASPAAPGSNPLADLWNSATGASNGRPAGLAADGGGGGEGGGSVVADFLSKLLGAGAGAGGGGGGGETVEQLKEALGGGRAMADVLGALAGAVGGGGGGAGAAAGGRR